MLYRWLVQKSAFSKDSAQNAKEKFAQFATIGIFDSISELIFSGISRKPNFANNYQKNMFKE